MITDCVDGKGAGTDDLDVARWIAAGSPSLTGVKWLGSAFHMGRESADRRRQPGVRLRPRTSTSTTRPSSPTRAAT